MLRTRSTPPFLILLLFPMLLALAVWLLFPAAARAQDEGGHTVQAGETLSEIAKLYGVPMADLMALNGIPNPDAIYTGQVLDLPGAVSAATPTPEADVRTHTVQPGETLSEIAKAYGVPLDVLSRLNGIDNANTIVSGRTLRIPAPAVAESATPDGTQEPAEQPTEEATQEATQESTATPAPDEIGAGNVVTHTVQPGETASEIAKLYGVALDELMARNGILNANRLYVGAVLVIPRPDAEATGTPTEEATEETNEEVTEEVTEEATEEVTEEVTEEATEEATEEPTEEATPEAESPPREAPPLSDRPQASLNRIYTVVSGDTPARIALRFGFDAESLLRLNNLPEDVRFVVGEELLLPATEHELGVKSEAEEYTVKPGDSLSAIAKAHGLTLAELMGANGISNPNLIAVGQSLVIPGQALEAERYLPVGPQRSGFFYYTVQGGDTISELARDLATTRLALLEYNDLPDESTVYNGMELRVPFGAPELPRRQPPVPTSGTSFLVSLSRQQCWVYQGKNVLHQWTCSTGYGKFRTRTGTFAVQSKIDNAKSNVWQLDMPYWLGIYDVGSVENGIHGLPVRWDTGKKIWGTQLGQPATFGCAMLDDPDAATLYDLAYIGMPVHIIQ